MAKKQVQSRGTNQFRIGLPNRGRSRDVCLNLFTKIPILDTPKLGQSRCYVHSYEVIFARSEDLPGLLNLGVIDIATIGNDYVMESGYHLLELASLGFCQGALHVLVPQDSSITKLNDLGGVTIATQLPKFAKRWLKESNISANVLPTSGASEVYPYLELAEATIDIVASGATMRENDLRSIHKIVGTCIKLYTTTAKLEHRRERIEHLTQQITSVVEEGEK